VKWSRASLEQIIVHACLFDGATGPQGRLSTRPGWQSTVADLAVDSRGGQGCGQRLIEHGRHPARELERQKFHRCGIGVAQQECQASRGLLIFSNRERGTRAPTAASLHTRRGAVSSMAPALADNVPTSRNARTGAIRSLLAKPATASMSVLPGPHPSGCSAHHGWPWLTSSKMKDRSRQRELRQQAGRGALDRLLSRPDRERDRDSRARHGLRRVRGKLGEAFAQRSQSPCRFAPSWARERQDDQRPGSQRKPSIPAVSPA